jgi:hypothetical protein
MTAIHIWNWKKFPVQMDKYVGIVVLSDNSSAVQPYIQKLLDVYPSNVYSFNPRQKNLVNPILVSDLREIYDNEKSAQGKRTILLDFREIELDSSDLVYLFQLFSLPKLHMLCIGDLKTIPKICLTNSSNMFFASMDLFNQHNLKLKLSQVIQGEDFIIVTDYSDKDLAIYALKYESFNKQKEETASDALKSLTNLIKVKS